MLPLRDDHPRGVPALVVWALIAANVAVFFYSVGLGGPRELIAFVSEYSFVPLFFFDAPLDNAYRLVTSAFLHGSFGHIFGNMLFLWVFGHYVETRTGRGPFLALYLAGGIAAALFQGLFAPTARIPMLGASGAVSAVLGAYFVLSPGRRVLTFVFPFFLFWLPAWIYLGYWIFFQFIEGTLSLGATGAGGSGVAWWAHVGGFVFGALAIRFFLDTTSKTSSEAP